MPKSIVSEIEYFFHEGKENMEACLQVAFDAAILRDIEKIVIFTGVGEGPKAAIERFLSQEQFSHIKVIAVTFPCGQAFESEEKECGEASIPPPVRALLRDNNIPVVRAHLPFNPIKAHYPGHGVLGQDLTLIGNALNMFCGSMSLCVQAAIMACDAGEVDLGEHIITLTSDTAILVRTAPTERLLTDFIIREILCKPMRLTVVKKEDRIEEIDPPLQIELSSEFPELARPTS